MKSSTTHTFWKGYQALPAWVQRQAKSAYHRFLDNPQHPGLQFKQILKQSSIYSIRVTENYRALGVLDGDEIIWFWIGSHADYDQMIVRLTRHFPKVGEPETNYVIEKRQQGMNIVLTGSVAYDYLMTFPGYFKEQILPERLASISLSFLVDSMSRQRGGTAPNIAYNLALLGGHPRVMATVGEDFADYRQFLEGVGVDTSLMEVVPGKFTASFFATTDKDNAQIASFYPGAMADAARQKIRDVTPRPDLVIISPNDPMAMKNFAAECRELGIPYLYDPSQQVLRLAGDELARDLECAHFLFVNDYEFGLICKKTGMTQENILEHVDILVVTRGKEGAHIYVDGQEIFVPVFPTEQIVDPTGVGDAFRGGFLIGYSRGWDWKLCGEVGALAAAYCLEQLGPQGHHYTVQEFIARFRQYFDDGGKLDQLIGS